MATNLYAGILTDTGSFRHGSITTRTFDICRQIAETGISLTDVAASIYTNGSLGHLRLSGRVLDRIRIECDGKIALLVVNDTILTETGCDPDDMEGIVNLPLAARDILVVILARETNGGLRVSLRSKKGIDVRSVAVSFGGGGHLNAAGLTVENPTQNTLDELISRVAATILDADK
jgi:phosphoesterase RecJ-like protein